MHIPIMTSTSPLSFSHQNLRNRSFRGQNLQTADFKGCDLRGCDFRGAQLQGANFAQARLGPTPSKFLISVALALGTAVVTANAVSQIIFGILAITPHTSSWIYVVVLRIGLAIAGAAASRQCWQTKLPRKFSRNRLIEPVARGLSAAISAALLGAFYGSSATDNNLLATAVITVALGGTWTIVHMQARSGVVAIATTAAGAIMAYGFTFLAGITAGACLQAHKLAVGVIWGGISLVYIQLSLRAIAASIQAIRQNSGTAFSGADLTDAKFEGVQVGNANFADSLIAASTEK
ncbi:MAG: pentapeptide repeat-containing protein [Cyanothece sp. SIO1E1]|nr:pentapeptide repeat-containing protein [Cyanothece sp. SIO1E1]